MGCNTKTTVEADFSSVASTIATIELATTLAYDYPDFMSDALLQLNDPSVVIPAIRFGIENLNDSITSLYDEILNNPTYSTTIPTSYPALAARIDQPTPISYTELADFLTYMSYPDTTLLNRYIVNDPSKVLTDLDHYYDSQMSGSSVNLCSLLDNPFANVLGVVDSITSLTQNILTMIPSMASRLQSFAEMIKQTVENVFKMMKDVVTNIGGTLASIAQGLSHIPAVFAGLSKSLSNEFASLQNLFSDMNLQNIKDGIDKFVTKAVAQFQKIIENPQVVLYLLYMFCKTSSFIESALKTPVQSFQTKVGNIQTEQNILKINSAPRTQSAIAAGRPVATQQSIDRVTTQATASHNAAVSNAITSGKDELPSNVSYANSQQQNLTHPDPHSWSNLAFDASVINNSFWKKDINVKMTRLGGGIKNPKDMGYSVDVGYYKCELKVLEMMNEVGKILGTKLTILSAYRDPVYNEWLHNTGHATAAHSQHMVGKALDTHMNGVDRDLFVSTCKKVGFTGFGRYSTFIHADIGPARNWNG